MMLEGILVGLSITLVLFVVFLIGFRKQLRAMREKKNSIYQRLFKKRG